MNVRGMGAGDGFTFSYSEDGRPEMVSLYGDMLAQMGSVSAPEAYLPADVNSVWPAIRQLAVAGDPALENILPAALSEQVPGQFAVLDPVAGMHRPVDPSSVTDVGRLTERRTTNLEVGYKGLLFGRLAAGIDVYYTRMHNFIGPLMVETPHVFIDSAAFVDVLTDDIVATSGGALDSATAEAVAGSIYDEFRELPIGLVSPEELQNPTDVVMTYRNFGEVDLFGVDLSLTYHFNEHWNISGNYSYISKNMFRDLDGVTDLAVNAPRHKFGGCVQYLSSRLGLDTRLNFRWVDGFPMNSGVYIGEVKRYAVFDLNIAYDLTSSTRVALTVQNLFDNRHAEFVGAPEMGRLAILRVTQSF
ncbi:MAG: TonB-dependent receptor [Candidatus Zixiibacteriota bacterium]|nr:MAG: TonB-dependent receptor [candidate division Zixibacteria bacterium]